ncbi:MAG TPA: BamA/TamA family outer membrane protein [Thermoanaerobaculia bacterium]|jgi:hypothetical protein
MIRRLLPIVLLAFASAANAASEYPPSLRWRTIDTAHFQVHYHGGEDALARRAAAIAEDIHTRLVPLMRWTPRGRTHLILTDHVDVSNGSATTFPSNRIEIYVSAPGGDPSSELSYYDDWLDLVITHEYTHILHLDEAHALPALLRRLLGRNPAAFPNEFSPLWLTEGLATFAESELTDAGRVKGTFVEMVLRTAAIEDHWPSEAQAGGLTPFWPGGAARYYFGSKFLTWLARRNGTASLANFTHAYASRIVPYFVNRTARKVFGASITELWETWTREQTVAYRNQLEALRATGLTEKQRLTSLGYSTQHLALSPDGTRLAYTHRGPFERPTIRVYDLAAGREVATHEVHSASSISWSPDGKSIAYSDLEYVGSFSLLSDLYVWRIGETRERRITRGARLKHPAFTPDGQALVAVANRAGRNTLVEVDAVSGAVRTLVQPDDETQFSEPDVRNDRIVLSEWKAGRIDVVTYSRKGVRMEVLTAGLPRSTNAAPRFAGDDVIFSSDVTGIANIYSVPMGGGAIRRLTNVYGGAFFPATRDGRTLYFADYHANGFDVARATAADYRITPADRTRVSRTVAAARTDVTDRPYSPLRSALPKWWSPIISDGTYGITTSGGDVLGFHQYTATLTNDGHALVYAYDRLYPTITLATLRYDDDPVAFRTPGGVVAYTETTQRLFAQVSAPWRRYERQAYGWIGGVRDHISGTPPLGVRDADLARVGVFRGTLQGVRAGAAFNTARTFGFSVSAEDGITARVDYENLSRALGSDATLQQYRADLRGYLSVPVRRSPNGRHVLAARVAGGYTTGDFILQRELRVGGTGAGEFLSIESRNFPVRGYDSSTLRGNRAALASLEYRVPLWQIDRGPSTWPLFFNRLVGDVFTDAGAAWQRNGGRETIASTGAEVALDVFLGYFAPLRYRMGIAYRWRDHRAEPFIALETSF